jgi:hypothetical protein
MFPMHRNKAVPAGQWIVQLAAMDGSILLIRNANAGLGVFSDTSLTGYEPAEGKL